jgi:hypothetical protein
MADIIVTIESMAVIIERYKLWPDADGNFQISEAMFAEAQALDAKLGRQPRPVPGVDAD